MSKKIQPLFLVFGGELASVSATVFADLKKLDIVGFYSDEAEARSAWKSKAQQTVDQAQTRYFMLELNELLSSRPSE